MYERTKVMNMGPHSASFTVERDDRDAADSLHNDGDVDDDEEEDDDAASSVIGIDVGGRGPGSSILADDTDDDVVASSYDNGRTQVRSEK